MKVIDTDEVIDILIDIKDSLSFISNEDDVTALGVDIDNYISAIQDY